MTRSELLKYMDNLVVWGHDQLKCWRGHAVALQKGHHMALSAPGEVHEKSCVSENSMFRSLLQNMMASICKVLCEEINAYPKRAQCQTWPRSPSQQCDRSEAGCQVSRFRGAHLMR